MASDLDKLVLDSNTPAFVNKESGSFNISISGVVGVGATATFSGTVNFTNTTGYIRYYMTQNVVPAIARYTSSQAVPLAQLVGGSSFSPWLACSGPSTETAPNIYLRSTGSSATVDVSVTNGGGSTMTLTATTITIHYTSFVNTNL